MRSRALDRAVVGLPLAYPGPGGAVAVLQNGRVIARHAWGFADIARRVPFTARTLFRVCSITKQFTCAAALAVSPDLSVLDAPISAAMPLLEGKAPGALHLAHNQSGLRDYWATAMLSGAPVEGAFDAAAARRLIGRTASLHFQPGTRYAYCNQNFRILGDALEAHTGHSYADLLHDHVFERTGMRHARLWPDTATMPDGTEGYEGSVEFGFFPAVNRVFWTGDAGVIASLDDMIAWERSIDVNWGDDSSLYHRLTAPVSFSDGNAARYGFGLARFEIAGQAATGHGGALRGWRSFRCHVPQSRLSVVVLFNHSQDARSAAIGLAQAILNPDAAPPPATHPALVAGWRRSFIEPETGLIVRLVPTPEGKVALHYGQSPEALLPDQNGGLVGANSVVDPRGDEVFLRRPVDNFASRLHHMPDDAAGRIDGLAGTYHSDEYAADFTCADAGGTLYGAFSGDLGQGEMQIMLPVFNAIWRLPMPRALDCAPPGDWTLEFRRDGEGRVVAVDIGCWLARRVVFRRVE